MKISIRSTRTGKVRSIALGRFLSFVFVIAALAVVVGLFWLRYVSP